MADAQKDIGFREERKQLPALRLNTEEETAVRSFERQAPEWSRNRNLKST
jgi:hypothetical protein